MKHAAKKHKRARRIAAIDELIAFAGLCAFAYGVCLAAELICRLAGCG